MSERVESPKPTSGQSSPLQNIPQSSSSQSSESWGKSPSHQIATACPLGPLVSEIGSDHILHCDAHSLVHRNLDLAKAAWLPTKGHCSKSRSRGRVQAR